MRTNLEESIANNTLEVIRFIPTTVSKRSTLYCDVNIASNRTMTRIPEAENCSTVAIKEHSFQA